MHPEATDRMSGGQSCRKVTKVPIDENKIRRQGVEGWGEGVTGNEGICLKGRDRIARYLSGLHGHCCQCGHYSKKYKGPL